MLGQGAVYSLTTYLLEEDAALLIEQGLHRGEALCEDELVRHHHLYHEGVVRLRGGGQVDEDLRSYRVRG